MFETPQIFIVTSLPDSEKARMRQLIEASRNVRKTVYVVRGPAEEIRRLGS